MKKRYVLKNKKRFMTVVISLSMLIGLALFASSAYGYGGDRYDNVRVEKGDTLWSIAREYCKNGDIRKNIYDISKVNNLTDSMIFEGQDLKIPLS